MLDRVKLYTEMQRKSKELFLDESDAYKKLKEDWLTICADPLILPKTKAASVSWPLPSWQEKLNGKKSVAPIEEYHVISVDGSQIYPDRHAGVSCYLINTGTAQLHYDGREKPVLLSCEPEIFTGMEDNQFLELSPELVNGKRQDLELRGGVKAAFACKEELYDEPLLMLFDGSLIFWHLEAKDSRYKEMFFSRYIASLMALHTKKILTASYISKPKSRELINIIRAYRCDFDESRETPEQGIIRFSDGSIVRTYISEGERTEVFKNHAKVSEEYPDAVHPHFFYLHVGHEVGRVEIPAWIAKDCALVDYVASMILDQSKKGHGYPVALAEAHEQAVVKGADREFFYQLLSRMGMEQNKHIGMSLKLVKKRGMSI